MSKSIYMTIAAALLAACTYNPPPDVTLDGPANGLFVMGEPIILRFSEPVLKGSLEIRVWPGQKDLYDVEGSILPGVDPVLDTCAAIASTCGEDGGVKLSFVGDRTEAQLTAEPDALGPMGQPLVLEVLGTLADDSGHQKGVSRFFDFQIVETRWDPFADVTGEDITSEEVKVTEPLNVWEGPVLMHADFTSPIKLSQQFFCDLNVNQLTGDFVLLLTDADPYDWAPKNTNKPEELFQDTGDDSFIFIIHGVVSKDADGDMLFESEPVTLIQNIGPISFELRDMVTAGKIDETGEIARWDGTLAVKEIYYEVNGQGTTYPSDQANFEVFELKEEQIPEKLPYVCDPDPCSIVKGRCDLLSDWPPPAVCPDEE